MGETVTFKVTISSVGGGTTPTGDVTLSQETLIFGSSHLIGGVGYIQVSSFSAGIYDIRATYGGDATHQPLPSQPVRQVVNVPAARSPVFTIHAAGGTRTGSSVPVLLTVMNSGSAEIRNVVNG